MINNLLNYIEKQKIELIECEIPTNKVKGLYFDNTIVLDNRISTNAEKQCILAEEIGHYETSYGVILDTENVSSIKQENRARRWAYNELLPLKRFVDCYEARCRSRYEVAELLDVTEDFLDDAIKSYQEIYGNHVKVGSYIVYFEPFGVMKVL